MKEKGLKWLSKNEKKIEKYSGKWIAFVTNKGILSSGETVKEVIDIAEKKYCISNPFVFKVPRKDEEMYIL
ncbi:MAG: DUF5678 domain-containing protein [Elusimicrobiota bacterium]